MALFVVLMMTRRLATPLAIFALAVIVGLVHAARTRSESSATVVQRALKAMPWFVVGFVAMAALNSLGIFPPDVGRDLSLTASFLIVAVLAGVGLNVDLRKMIRLGPRPMLVGFLLASIMAVCSYALVTAMHIG